MPITYHLASRSISNGQPFKARGFIVGDPERGTNPLNCRNAIAQ
ncbi:hypothetical protein ALP58_102399 [Pseudomonas savastanoi]|uniref:Uncharacterized protein n=1 Tax=Pseudomonas savastanoi TaxID=29438 RepID=A0A3M5HBS5_PSESS|nr:hypothetical protein ALP58_102399 [Pseudomonas savastanoi]